MVSKNQIKLITSLQQKKFRQIHNLFIAEGVKVIKELLDSHYELEHVYVTETFFEGIDAAKITTISDTDLKRISCLSTPNTCLALFKIPTTKPKKNNGLIVALDNIRDPGNLGTIIRLCDWFGVEQIVCNEQTVDLYNPKVVQATMGSMARVIVSYLDLEKYLSKTPLPIFGTFMEGATLYNETLPQDGILIFGNEANGISKNMEQYVHHKLSIPRFGNIQKTESLNVATATAIFLSEFKRNTIEK
ncbi:TrmH family RNA methyltransferase [Flavobacterium aciduliphilum]|uniref:TrmH family RNA methyltransferase n=1 Tax=Flavobacterium aciduliphilum TaxID=1101402 RepID=A0A328YJM3_9FLAO|nr:RNA methyltransferase [Flavobacterium aciduliphilum]RAR74129.1 TrmH family RNA methyltransferase [Flavobacterium aciduliphilum]